MHSAVMAALVASFAGAWIETHPFRVGVFVAGVASFAGAWIETARRGPGKRSAAGRLLRGGVD